MTKRIFTYSMAAIAAMGLSLTSCSDEMESTVDIQSGALATRTIAVGEQYGLTTVDLLAGQHNDAGDVMIWNDYENVYVQVQMQNGWEMSHIHMFVGPKDVLLDPDNGYVNKNGSPKNGQFPINEDLNPAITEANGPWTYEISLDELYKGFGLEYDKETATSGTVCPVIALHAEVSKDGQSETAWGEGSNFVNKGEKKNGKGNGNSNGGGNWSMYIDNYCITFPEETPEEETQYEYSYEGSETAWAKDKNNLEYNPGQGGNWATYIQYEGTKMTATLYAGQHNEAGTVTLEPDGDKVKITFNIATESPENEGEWVLNKDNGNELIKIQGYNDAPSGNPAPGQFKTYKGTETTIVVDKYNYYGIHLDMAKLVVTEVSPEE